MKTLPHLHLCVMQPAGYVHSLGFLDPARYFRYQFRRLGATVSLSKNRLRHGAINFVFGAHLGFDADLRQRYTCVFVNLEQTGAGGAALSPAYLKLLATSAVVDYDLANVPGYSAHPEDVPVVPLQYAPYLATPVAVPLAERPIDLLFIGSMNPRRRALLERIEAAGVKVTQFDGPLYGPERDHFIRQAKAVFNAHFYPSSRFEQVRVSHCLSLGTPVISERGPLTRPGAAFEDSVFWFCQDDPVGDLERFFAHDFATPAFYAAAEAALQRFTEHDPIGAYADLLGFVRGYADAHVKPTGGRAETWQPARINLGSGKDYKLGWLNLDVLERTEPDAVLDLGRPHAWPLRLESAQVGPVSLSEGGVDLIYANNVLEHVPDLPELMGNCLKLLKTGGEFLLEVPYEHAPTAWQDPTHLRALNENSWVYYTDWFWYLGWFEHRFTLDHFSYLDAKLQPCDKPQAAFMRVVLKKADTTPKERMTARVMRPDFGLDDDPVPPNVLTQNVLACTSL